MRKRAFILAGGPTSRSKAGCYRIGFTVTKRLGNAVRRNRIRRRLRHAVAQVIAECAQEGSDYVVIGRNAAYDQPFADLIRDFRAAFAQIHSERRGSLRSKRQAQRS